MKNDTFKEGDLLAVVGGSVGKEDKKTDTAVITTVVAVGLHDLIVETQNGIHKVPKEICQKIDFSPGVLKRCKVKIPELGDLVLSYEKKPYSVEPPKKITGILYKVSYKMGIPDTCVIMCGTDEVETRFSNIVLLQSRQP